MKKRCENIGRGLVTEGNPFRDSRRASVRTRSRGTRQQSLWFRFHSTTSLSQWGKEKRFMNSCHGNRFMDFVSEIRLKQHTGNPFTKNRKRRFGILAEPSLFVLCNKGFGFTRCVYTTNAKLAIKQQRTICYRRREQAPALQQETRFTVSPLRITRLMRQLFYFQPIPT